jgi:hypothetical protein
MGTLTLFHFPSLNIESRADIYNRTLYLLFAAFPIVFQLHRGWSEGIGGLAFLGKFIFDLEYDTSTNSQLQVSHSACSPPSASLSTHINGT